MIYKIGNKNKKKAFSLAEVLITLGIIGVVAGMTIPVLMNQIQDRQFKEAAKEAYSKASQAVQLMKADNGGTLALYYGVGPSFKSAYMGYFKIAQDCSPSLCVPSSTSSGLYNGLITSKADTSYMSDGQFITADGMLFAFHGSSGLNDIIMTVDVNGYQKGPNVFGRDVFMFQVLNDNLVPMGINNTQFQAPTRCNRNSPDNGWQGFGCMQYVMQGIDY